MAEQHGGKREGAGRKPGRLNEKTLEAMAVKKEYQERVRRNADKLFNAQLSLATGTQMLFVIHTDSKGNRRKPEMITDPALIQRFLEENEGVAGELQSDKDRKAPNSLVEDYYFLTTKLPDSRTISDMLDRTFGKADTNIDLTSGGERIRTAPIIVSDIGGEVRQLDNDEAQEETS